MKSLIPETYKPVFLPTGNLPRAGGPPGEAPNSPVPLDAKPGRHEGPVGRRGEPQQEARGHDKGRQDPVRRRRCRVHGRILGGRYKRDGDVRRTKHRCQPLIDSTSG